MPEEFWLQVEAAHLSGKQPAFIQAAAAENLIQMTSSFLPSDLSGILFYSTPPLTLPLSFPESLQLFKCTPCHSISLYFSLTLPPFPPHLLLSSHATLPPPALPPPKGII